MDKRDQIRWHWVAVRRRCDGSEWDSEICEQTIGYFVLNKILQKFPDPNYNDDEDDMRDGTPPTTRWKASNDSNLYEESFKYTAYIAKIVEYYRIRYHFVFSNWCKILAQRLCTLRITQYDQLHCWIPVLRYIVTVSDSEIMIIYTNNKENMLEKVLFWIWWSGC